MVAAENILLGGALGLGGLGAFGGGLFGGGGKTGLKSLLMEMERKLNMGFTRSQGYQLRGLDALLGGYDKALGAVKRTGSASKLSAIQTGQKAQASVEQNLVNRGLSNTTFAAQVPAVAAGETQRTVAAVDQAVAQAVASLEAAKGGAAAGAYGGLSALSQGYAQQQMLPLQLAFQQVAAQPTAYDRLMQLLGAGGNLAGLYLGGGLGGGGGFGSALPPGYTGF